MIRRLIILLLIVVGFANEEMGELEKEMLYKQNDRSPLLAGICAFTPTMGHIYVGKWNKRLLTTLLPLGATSSLLFARSLSLHSSDYVIWYEYRNATEFWETLGYIPLIGYYFLQLQDAIYLAYQHNADLYEEIYGKEYIRPPKKSIIQKWIDKKEAKKIDK